MVESDPVPLKYLRKIAEHVQIRTMKINWQELGCKTDVVEPGSMMHDRAKKGGAMAILFPLKNCCRVFRLCKQGDSLVLDYIGDFPKITPEPLARRSYCTASPDCTASP